MRVGDDSDRDEVDGLIQGLMTGRRRMTQKAPPVDRLLVPRRPKPRRMGWWMSARQSMPSLPMPGPGKAFALGSAASLPHAPGRGRSLRPPGLVTMARMWIGLGLAYGISMTFWPYPKAYLWGLVLYLLSLALALVAGIWGARLSWDARLGAAHAIALSSVVWILWLGAAEIVPLIYRASQTP